MSIGIETQIYSGLQNSQSSAGYAYNPYRPVDASGKPSAVNYDGSTPSHMTGGADGSAKDNRHDRLELSADYKASASPAKEADDGKCETCEERKYQDESNDSSVSYQNPTNIAPQAVAGAVRAHEAQHVAHNNAKAAKEGREVVSSTVTIKTGICPECGKIYVSGGNTRTVTRAADSDRYSAGNENSEYKGNILNVVA